MPNIRIDLEYDGTDYHGWQIQPNRRTVQGELESALEKICREKIRVVAAGRTDAGVHAVGQVVSFKSEAAPTPEVLRRRLNVSLPLDIRARQVQVVADGFSARHSAIARCYRYQLLRGPNAILRRFYYELPTPVDVDAMGAAAEYFLGDQDFSAFVASDAGDSCRCLLSRASIRADDHAIVFEVTANRFLHNMVRRLTGILVEVGRGRVTPTTVREILRTQDRSRGGPCLPPNGLYLMEVRYPKQGTGTSPLIDGDRRIP